MKMSPLIIEPLYITWFKKKSNENLYVVAQKFTELYKMLSNE